MAVCDAQELIDADPCLLALPDFLLDVVITKLLCDIWGGDCDIQELLDDGKCFAALLPFDLEVIKTQLLCDIAST